MEITFNTEKLERMMCDFYSCTGMAATLYDASKKIVAASPAFTGFCSFIRTNKQCMENCNNSDRFHMEEALRTRQICEYTCHAGLKEVIIPIIYEDVLIAYLQVGQMRDENQSYFSLEKLKEISVKYGLHIDKLLGLYGEVPIVSSEKYNAACHILEVMVRSFWADELILYKRSMLSVKIEQYIADHLTERITIRTLCNKFFLSKNALYQLFHDELGTTVNEYIVQQRLIMAEEYLKSKHEINVTQVAALCGFPDYNYFIRMFKKQYGVTPLQYRKNISDS